MQETGQTHKHRVSIKVWADSNSQDCMDREGIRTTLSKRFDTEWKSIEEDRTSYRYLPTENPVVFTIAISIVTIISIGLKKTVELLAEDLYGLAKDLAMHLFKRSPSNPRVIRILIETKEGIQVTIWIEAFTSKTLEKSLKCDVRDLVPILLELFQEGRLPAGTLLKCYQQYPELIISTREPLPHNTKQIHIHKLAESQEGWKVTLLATDSETYLTVSK